jgi:hypothetical protein
MQTNNFNHIISILETATTDDMVIFDINNVIMTPCDKILRYCGHKYVSDCFSDTHTILGRLKYSELINQYRVKLVDSQIPQTIRNLQQKGIRVCGITRIGGRYGVIRSMDSLVRQQLSELDIEFSDNNSDIIYLDKKELLYSDGIIYYGTYKKGDIIKYLIQNHLEFNKIKKIYLIDDYMYNINDVSDACEQIGIDFVGIHYIEKSIFAETLSPSDIRWGEFQIKWFDDTRIWLHHSIQNIVNF